MTLYEMTQAAFTLYQLLEAEEIDEQTVADTIDGMGVGEKMEDYCKVIRQFEADAAAYKAEADKLLAKKKRAENAIERLKYAMLQYMKATGKTECPCNLFKVKVGTSKAANIFIQHMIVLKLKK